MRKLNLSRGAGETRATRTRHGGDEGPAREEVGERPVSNAEEPDAGRCKVKGKRPMVLYCGTNERARKALRDLRARSRRHH